MVEKKTKAAKKSATKEKAASTKAAAVSEKDAVKKPAKNSSASKAAPKKASKTEASITAAPAAAKTKTKAKAKTATKAKAKASATKAETKAKAKAPVKAKAAAKAAAKAPAKPKAKAAAETPAKPKTTTKAKVKAKEVKATTAPETAAKEKAAVKSTPASKSERTRGVVTLKFLVDLAKTIKEAVAPYARDIKGKEIVDTTASGDVTFQIDRVAEKTLQAYLRKAALPISYYSEDEGYSTFTSKPPKNLLIVDPIDGTRAAKNGFEGCVVSVASTRVLERPTVADIDFACVMEILGDRIFLAERGKGSRYYTNGRLKRPKLSQNNEIENMAWSMTIPARPAELIFPTAARIIDLSSLKGGFFPCNSTSYSLTRLITGQLDACVDIANRYYRDIPERVEDYFINAGRGKIIGIAPYDMAAALLITQEAGCIVTDAYGNSFDDLLLLDSSKGNHRSIIAASNPVLHKKLLSFFNARIKQYEALLTQRSP
ncbi:MAG: inositol monophosphatase family protein [Candidatus Hydrogenedentales bacterium]